MAVELSILDLAPIGRGQTAADSFAASVALAQHAEQLGYKRVWYAEHHNMASIASSATSVLIAHVGAHTETIRLGAGGVMLPNHAPLVIAEQFGTLAAMYPGRIDLGLGRAPGSDQNTMFALRRDPSSAGQLPAGRPRAAGLPERQTRRAAASTRSPARARTCRSTSSAHRCSERSSPRRSGFRTRSHRTSRRRCWTRRSPPTAPSSSLRRRSTRPYVIAGVNVLAADTVAEAQAAASGGQAHARGQPVRTAARCEPARGSPTSRPTSCSPPAWPRTSMRCSRSRRSGTADEVARLPRRISPSAPRRTS